MAVLDPKKMELIKNNIPQVEKREIDILTYVRSISKKVEYDKVRGLIVVADMCDTIVGALDALGYPCDNLFFGGKPNRADGLLIYYNPKHKSNKGYLIINKEVAESMLA